jgi:ATP/maltotriose-dependent transcriptional regulator MalT
MVEAFLLERFHDAARHAERGASLCRASGQGQLLLPLLMALSWSLRTRGHVERALDVAQETVEANRVTGNEYGLMATLCVLAGPAFDSGNLGMATAASAEAFDIARRIEAGAFAPISAVAFARCLLDAGDAVRAREVVVEGCGGAQLPALTRFSRCETLEVLTRAELALGNITAATAWANQARAYTQDRYLALETATADRAMAAVLLADGNARQAAALALVAAEGAGRAGARIDEGRARLLAGRALAQTGERLGAIAELERVEAEMLACGAARYRDRAARELERLDRSRARTHAATVAGLDGLTERERRVAELITAGRTNREIAGELYLSVKTVERHVSHVFDKLGVSTRASVASIVASAS